MRLPRLRRSRSDLPDWARLTARATGSVSTDEQREFTELFHAVHARFRNHAERYLARDDAHDAVADAMAILWLRWAGLTPEQRNDRFAFGILRNCIRGRLGKAAEKVALDDAEQEIEVHAVRAAEEAIREAELADRDARVAAVRDLVLSTMPTRRREVLLLILEQAMSYRDAGEALGLSKGTIAQHMRLAHATLRREFIRAGLHGGASSLLRLPAPEGGPGHD